jgi:general secretion pathway protein B
MSFILDALKKSETERQQQGSAEFSNVPTSSEKPNPARWLWLLAALLGINFAVLIGILMRSEPSPTETVAEKSTQIGNVEETTEAPTPDEAASFEEQIAVAIGEHEEPEEHQEPAPPPRPTSKAIIPTIDQLRLDGSLQLAELHLDIHVYSDDPAGRFVFINMVKHREKSRIAEGPIVNEITRDGVILRYQGRNFLLPRQ